jgi:class 3 adenylate cyclase
MQAVTERGAQHPVSLRFLDEELEARYQHTTGTESLSGFRVITGASVLLWGIAAFLVPVGTDIPSDLATPVCLVMAAVSLAAYLASRWTDTLDRQHAVASVLTAGNGLVILALASAGGALPGYGVSAVMLLFAYGFVSRTRFIYAALRSAIIAIGFIIAAAAWQGSSLLLDGFVFVAAVVGTLLALRLIERARRRVFHQDLVIAEQREALEVEMEKSDRLLLNVLPAAVSARLKEGERTIADEYPAVSILFADIVGFTPMAARLSAGEVVALLGSLFSRFDDIVAERGLEKIKTIGDCYMAAGGLPSDLQDHASQIVDLGLAMLAEAARTDRARSPIALRIGVHSGAAVGGVIGSRKFAYDVWGDTVNVASRLQEQGVPGRVHVSEATWRLVDDRFECETRGVITLRGHGDMSTFLIIGPIERSLGAD